MTKPRKVSPAPLSVKQVAVVVGVSVVAVYNRIEAGKLPVTRALSKGKMRQLVAVKHVDTWIAERRAIAAAVLAR